MGSTTIRPSIRTLLQALASPLYASTSAKPLLNAEAFAALISWA